jgi:hypothetical protein
MAYLAELRATRTLLLGQGMLNQRFLLEFEYLLDPRHPPTNIFAQLSPNGSSYRISKNC